MPGDPKSEKIQRQGEQKWAQGHKSEKINLGEPKGAKGYQKEANWSQKGADGKKEADGSQKGTTWKPKGTKSEPTGDPNAWKKLIFRQGREKIAKIASASLRNGS